MQWCPGRTLRAGITMRAGTPQSAASRHSSGAASGALRRAGDGSVTQPCRLPRRRPVAAPQASKGGWGLGSLFDKAKEAIPDEAVLRNEEVKTASEANAVGVRLYNEGRRTVAVEYFDKALTLQPTPLESCVVQFNLTCCHSYNGNQDNAEFAMQNGFKLGMDFEAWLALAPTAELVELEASTQVRRRLVKFAKQLKGQ